LLFVIVSRQTWLQAKLEQVQQPYMRAWAWTLWSYDIPFEQLPKQPFEIVCRAMDIHSNTQPDTVRGIWNIRGLMNNAWHRLTMDVDRTCLLKDNHPSNK
jgi:sulfite oxidase